MSYEKIKTIKIDTKQGKVIINSACNNVRPLTYYKGESKYFSDMLKEKGLRAVEIEILKTYEGGSFQQGKNKFTKALLILRYVFGEEYFKFNWRNHNAKYGSEEYNQERESRESKEFEELLNKCFDYNTPKNKFVITKDNFGEKIYARVCPTCIKWSRFKDKITKFDFKEQAEDSIYDSYKGQWVVEEL